MSPIYTYFAVRYVFKLISLGLADVGIRVEIPIYILISAYLYLPKVSKTLSTDSYRECRAP